MNSLNTQSRIRPDAILPFGNMFALRLNDVVVGEYPSIRDAWGKYLAIIGVDSMPRQLEQYLEIDESLGYLDISWALIEMLKIQRDVDELNDFDQAMRNRGV